MILTKYINLSKIISNPKNPAIINKSKMNHYINLHKKQNRPLMKQILDKLQYVSFDEFYDNLIHQVKLFNSYLKTNKIKKYVYVIGVGDDLGSSSTNFNIFKSNFWTFLLSYKYLDVKPYDIMLNLNTSLRLHYPDIKDYLIMDDCSYSGDQLVNCVLYSGSTELMFKKENTFMTNDMTKNPMYDVVNNKICNIHLIVPYLSKPAFNLINDLELKTGFNIKKYVSVIINPYKDLLDKDTLDKIRNLYQIFQLWNDFGNYIPIFFSHKIADSLSTIELIIVKGQVIDNPKKRYVFIDVCEYKKNDPDRYDLNPSDPNYNNKKVYCPIPPYLHFQKILQKNGLLSK